MSGLYKMPAVHQGFVSKYYRLGVVVGGSGPGSGGGGGDCDNDGGKEEDVEDNDNDDETIMASGDSRKQNGGFEE